MCIKYSYRLFLILIPIKVVFIQFLLHDIRKTLTQAWIGFITGNMFSF